jgi:ATP-dependent DNA ligase
VDSKEDVVHSVCTSAASLADKHMLPDLLHGEQIPSGEEWIREVKWDGYRVCVVKKADRVAIRTKSNQEPSARYKHIGESLSASHLPDCVLDAELVALGYGERPSSQLLQQSRRSNAPVGSMSSIS